MNKPNALTLAKGCRHVRKSSDTTWSETQTQKKEDVDLFERKYERSGGRVDEVDWDEGWI